MTRIMRDSTSPGDIPTDGTQLVAGYVNGLYAWDQAGWDRFAGIPCVRIDVNGTDPSADVLDVELGDATVSDAVAWARQKLRVASEYLPVIYCSRSVVPSLESRMSESGLYAGHHYKLWVATLDGTRELPDMTGVTAVQYAGSLQTGGHYDESVIYDASWKAAPKPPAPPPPAPAPVTLVKVTATATFSDGSTKSWTV